MKEGIYINKTEIEKEEVHTGFEIFSAEGEYMVRAFSSCNMEFIIKHSENVKRVGFVHVYTVEWNRQVATFIWHENLPEQRVLMSSYPCSILQETWKENFLQGEKP